LLDGERGPRRDVVLLNAGAALLIAGRAATVAAGVHLAAASVDEGRARRALQRLRKVCA
jgi:anthranilate phosphoribosyltransferase